MVYALYRTTKRKTEQENIREVRGERYKCYIMKEVERKFLVEKKWSTMEILSRRMWKTREGVLSLAIRSLLNRENEVSRNKGILYQFKERIE